MTEAILQTKVFIPPARPNEILRARLMAKLDAGLSSQITLVSAPAGYGKTTLIAGWLDKKKRDNSPAVNTIHLCWLSLDSYDNDPNRFWQYVVAALETAVPGLGDRAQPLFSANPLPPPPALLTGLLNTLAEQAQRVVLVIDDYQVIFTPAIHEGLTFLIEHAPIQLRLILLTRADPPLPLARWRVRGLVSEIRTADIRFTLEESAFYLREMVDFPLSADDIAALETRTEGWIAGLQLTALSLHKHPDPQAFLRDFTGSHYYIMEYLAEEVLRRQDPSVLEFLLQTSILPRLSGSLCDAVTGRSDGQRLLTQLQRQNLFISALDTSRQWFRYHALFQDLLSTHLRQTIDRDMMATLHRRAGEWSAEHNEWELGTMHFLQAEDPGRAGDLVVRAYQPLAAQGRIATWQGLLKQIPESFVSERPSLFVRYAWTAFLNGSIQEAEQMLNEARKRVGQIDPSPETQALRGELATYLATLAFFREDPQLIIDWAAEALALLPPEALTARARAMSALGMGVSMSGDTRRAVHLFQETTQLARQAGNPFFLAHALELVADGQWHTGQLRASAATCREIIDLGCKDRPVPLPFAGNGYLKLAAVLVEWRELDQAQDALAKGLALSQQGGIGYNALPDLGTQVRLYLALEENQKAREALGRAQAIFEHNPSPFSAVSLAQSAVLYYLHTGDVYSAVSWAEGRAAGGETIDPERLPLVIREVQQITLARTYLAQGNAEAVLVLDDLIFERAKGAGLLARAIEIGLLAALALQMQGETAAALERVRAVLSLTRPEGYRQIFVELGSPMLRLLNQLPAAEEAGIQEIRQAFPALPPGESAELIEPLSPRELEVLHLIAAGLSNKQISAELIVSQNTVKKHTSHIYEKLGVNGRTQAVARAHELNLI